jgi:hypothetical protein
MEIVSKIIIVTIRLHVREMKCNDIKFMELAHDIFNVGIL